MSKNFISFQRVGNLEELTKLREFAAEFDHQISSGDCSGTIMMVRADSELIGYVIIVNRTIAYPAWHPEKSTPYLVKKAIDEFTAWAKIEAAYRDSDIAGFVARSDDSPFTDDHMEKLGLRKTEMRIFEVRNK